MRSSRVTKGYRRSEILNRSLNYSYVDESKDKIFGKIERAENNHFLHQEEVI